MSESIKVVDFFCGCGGASAGFKKAGMDVILGVDFDQSAAESYQLNFKNATFINEDVRVLSPAKVAKKEPRIAEGPLLFTACAPCQPFSAQNKFKDADDHRISLLDEMHVYIKKWKPEFIFIENVPGMQNVSEEEEGPFRRFIEMLVKQGYQYKKEIVFANHYGVPQKRKRLVVVASRLGDISIPARTHGDGLKPYTTVRKFIQNHPLLNSGEMAEKDELHVAARLTDINIERIRHTPEGGDRRNWPSRLINKCHKDYKGHTDTYGRMSWDSMAPTLTTKCNSYSNGRFGHPDVNQDRAITIREALLLQTFPKKYKLSGSLVNLAKQVGNAVPVELAYHFGLEINACLDRYAASKGSKKKRKK